MNSQPLCGFYVQSRCIIEKEFVLHPMKYLPTLVLAMLCPLISVAQTARIQFIHNSPDPGISAIDIYVDGSLVADSLEFHEATAFMNITAGVEVTIAICPGTSIDAGESFYTLQNTFIASEKYVAIANGMVQSGYNPQVFFELGIHSGALEAGTSTSSIDVLFCHGNTDVGYVDFNESELLLLPIFENVPFGGYAGYQPFLTADYVFELLDHTSGTSIGKFQAPFAQNALGGIPVTIVSSGFFNQQMNQGGEGIGLWLAKPLGGPMYKLPVLELGVSAGIQIIHSISDPSANVVDVYFDDEIFADNLEFRYATPLQNVQASRDIIIGFAPSNSTSSEDCFYRDTIALWSGSLQCAVIMGNTSDAGFNPQVPLQMNYINRVPDPGQVSLKFVHAASDYPTADLTENQPTQNSWVNDLSFGETSELIMIPAEDYVIELTNADGTYSFGLNVLPVAASQGQILTLVLNGYADPSQNNTGPAGGLWLATDAGGMMTELEPPAPAPVYTEVQFIHNSADAALSEMDIYADGVLILNNLSFHAASPYLNLQAGVPIDISVAESTSNSVEDAFINFTYVLNENESYLFIADGIYSMTGYNPAPDFQFVMYEGARMEAVNTSETDVIVYQGCTDMPSVMIKDQSDLSIWAAEVAHQDFTEYMSLQPGSEHGIAFITSMGDMNLGQYALNILTPDWDGKSVTVLLNGFLNPANNSDGQMLQCWYAAADGSTGILGHYTSVHETVKTSSSVYPVPAHDKLFIKLGDGFHANPVATVVSSDGRIVDIGMQNIQPGIHAMSLSGLRPGLYTLRLADGILSESVHFIVE